MQNRKNLLVGSLLVIVAALLALIVTGNTPFSSTITSLVISWQGLLVFIGLIGICYRIFFKGVLFMAVGIYFLLPEIYSAFIAPSMEYAVVKQLYWIGVALFAGLALLFAKVWYQKSFCGKFFDKQWLVGHGTNDFQAIFSGLEQIVVEKPFTGSLARAIFGGITIDLRNTELKEGDTFLDVQCVFGGIVLIVPQNWVVSSTVVAIFGGVDDKRGEKMLISPDGKRLVMRGGAVFGGIEVRNMKEGEFIADDDTSGSDKAEVMDSITVKHNNKVHIIPLDELIYIQADGDYVVLVTAQGKFLKEQTMKYFETSLPEERFMRIHRSYIVNMAHINCVESKGREVYFVLLKDGTSLRASGSGYQALKGKLSI